MSMTRRDFLASVAGAAGGIALSRIPYQRLVGLQDIPPYESVPEVERWVRSSCLLCPGGCGIEVRLLDGSPVKIRGNPLHPINRGGLCAVGQEGLHVLYHPDRIRSPLRQTGERGSQGWVQISWEEALAEVARKLGEIVSSGKPESILLFDGFGRGLMTRLLERFATALGSPNHISDTQPSGLSAMMKLAQGVQQAPAYDLEGAEHVLSFGVPLLEGWRSPIQGQRGYASLRGARGDRRRRLVQIDTRQSLTATRADRWVPIKPGGYGALALSLAYVILRERGLYDVDFVKRHTFGFESWKDASGTERPGFRDHVLFHYKPDRTEEITGVPPDVVGTIAKEFAAAASNGGRAVAVVDHSATMVPGGVQAALAVQALNVLVGSIDREGGALVGEKVPFAEWPPLPDGGGEGAASRSRIDGAGGRFPLAVSAPSTISNAMLGEGAEARALLLYYSNPCFSTPEPKRFRRALAKIPFVVSFTPMHDDTSRFADLILPDHTYLERWQDAPGPDSFPYAVLGVTQPAVKPLYDTRHTGDVILGLAKRMGGTVAGAFPWKSFQEVVETSSKGIFDAGRGTVLTDEATSDHVRDLEMRGWWHRQHEKFGDFWKEALEKGGWWDPAYAFGLWGQVFRTPSRKYEFGSQALVELARQRAAGGEGGGPPGPEQMERALKSMGIESDLDQAFLPHQEEVKFHGFRDQSAFHLNLFRPLVPNSGFVPDLPWVREILNTRMAWDTWAEIHTEDAERLEIEDGSWIWLVSPVGRIRVRALIGREAQVGMVNVPFGIGREVAGRWGSQRGANPNHLIPATSDAVEGLAGVPLWLSSRVRIVKDGAEAEHA